MVIVVLVETVKVVMMRILLLWMKKNKANDYEDTLKTTVVGMVTFKDIVIYQDL